MKNSRLSLKTVGTEPAMFVGREAELRELEGALLGSKGRSALIIGPFGVGKTSLARQFIERHRKDFLGGVAILNARRSKAPSEVLRQIRERLSEVDLRASQLLVLDEIDSYGRRDAGPLLQLIKETYPEISILGTAVAQVPGFDLDLRLGDLTRDELESLWMSPPLQLPAEELYKLYDRVGGNPRRARVALQLLHAGQASIADFDKYLTPFNAPGILGPDGNPIRRGSAEEVRLISGAVTVTDDLLERLRKDPDGMDSLTPRQFEQVVAEILSRQGYEVYLTPASKDGGKDIYVAKKTSLGSFLYLVECKKYARNRPVGVELIRQLYGVVEQERATAGILATTSTFTKGARQYSETVRYRLKLKDYMELHRWITESGQVV